MASDHTLWGLDPLFSSYRKVLACTIQKSLVVGKSRNFLFFSLNGRPVSKVEIAGVVVAINTKELRVTTFIDDGTGVIRCLKNFYADEELGNFNTIFVGSKVSIQGIIVACDSNTDAYGAIISVKKLHVFGNSNEEIFHWTSSMILSEAEYECKLGAPIHNYRNAIARAQVQSLQPVIVNNSECPDIVNDITNTSSSNQIEKLKERQATSCACDQLTAAVCIVKERLHYCCCMASKMKYISLDPSGKFGVILLNFLLRLKKIMPPGSPILLNVKTMKLDKSIRNRAEAFLSEIIASRKRLLSDVYTQDEPEICNKTCMSHDQDDNKFRTDDDKSSAQRPDPKSFFSDTCSRRVRPRTLDLTADFIHEADRLIETLLRDCCLQLKTDGIFVTGANSEEYVF